MLLQRQLGVTVQLPAHVDQLLARPIEGTANVRVADRRSAVAAAHETGAPINRSATPWSPPFVTTCVAPAAIAWLRRSFSS